MFRGFLSRLDISILPCNGRMLLAVFVVVVL